MFNKLRRFFTKNESKPLIIHICPLCKEGIRIKHLKKKKCCGRIYHNYCYNDWKYLFRMKPCCLN